MAIGGTGLPPWLNIQPTDFLQATQAGTAAGINVAELRQRARQQAAALQEAQARRAQEQWEAQERMRFAAQQQAARLDQDREEAQALAEYRRGQLAQGMASVGETERHHKAMEGISLEKAREALERGEATIVQHPEAPGMLFLRNPSGAESVIERGDREPTQLQRDTMAMRALGMRKPSSETEQFTDPTGFKARQQMADQILGRYFSGAPNMGTNAVTNAAQGRIRVRSPQGKEGTIPASQRAEAEAAGYTILE